VVACPVSVVPRRHNILLLLKIVIIKFVLFYSTMALFRSKIFLDFDTVALLFLFDKHYPIMEQLGLKDSSRDLQINCAINYLFIYI